VQMLATAATNYPFLNIFWTMLIFFAWVAWIWIVVTVLIDLFRRHDMSGWGKAAWTLLVILLPFVGVLSYLIVNSGGMAERSNKEATDAQAQVDDYIRQTAGGNGAATEIERGKQLLDSGAINQAEFDSIKKRALAA
jgi:hypothetical protein